MSVEISVDVPLRQCDQERISEAVGAIAESRAVIEQTKGMLMFVLGVDADRAFEILRWQSQQHNVKLRLIAEQISMDLLELAKSRAPGHRSTLDGLVRTAHQRVIRGAA